MAESPISEPSAASQLLVQHSRNPHAVTIEDVGDDGTGTLATGADVNGNEQQASWVAPMSTKAAGKQKEREDVGLDTQSHDLFPELGGPKTKASGGMTPIWGATKNNVNESPIGNDATNGNGPVSASGSGANTPDGAGPHKIPALTIPGRNVETMILDPQHVLPRAQLKRPLPDVIKDLNRRSRAQVNMSTMGNGKLKFEASGPQEMAQQALLDLVQQIGSKQTITVPIPHSARAHIIGKGGATIKSLQEKSGARIQLPRSEELPVPLDEDDDTMINVVVEGNAHSAAKARDAILKIAGERTASVNIRMRGIPSEFFPFIASHASRLEEHNGVQVRVPAHEAWSLHPPRMPAAGARPVFAPPVNDSHIQVAGDRAAVQVARAAIERQVDELRQQLVMEQLSIQRGRHRFIIGDRGIPMTQFFDDTGCTVVLPTDEDDDVITVIGPPEQVQAGLEAAMDLAMNMQCSNIDISRFHRQVPGGAAAHARNVTRYLRQRKEIDRLEKMYNVHFNTPFSEDGALPWELYSRDGKNAIRAQSEIKSVVEGHPPSRMSTVNIDPFFHQHFRNEVVPRVRQDHGVQLVLPETSETGQPILLVYEGPSSPEQYQVPRSQPDAREIQEMQQCLQDAQNHILDLVNQQEAIVSTSIDVPQKFHDKLRRFIKKEQENRDQSKIPVRVSNLGTTVTIRGPSSSVQSLAAKCHAFLDQEQEDEKERGFTMDFDFPQKFANHLIGKGGSNIRELRDKFDVEIQVQDGKVQLKGPQKKAEAAKAHISALGRQLADEATHVLKIEPKFHRELVGPQGSQINRLQTRYKVLIFFPRAAKVSKDEDSGADATSDVGKTRRQQAPDEVLIRGPRKGADEARDEILSLLQYLRDNSFSAVVSMQQKHLPSLIGQGGSGMEQLRQVTGAKIDIPNGRDSPSGPVEIQIKGTKAQVAAAKKLLEEKKAVFEDTITKTVDVERKFHKALIGTGGATLREIISKAGGSDDRRESARGVSVRFPKAEADGDTITVEGRSDVVDKVVAQMQSMAAERASQVTGIVEVAAEKHRSLIGRGGEVKRNLESQFKVSIDIPRQGSGQTGVKIVGQAADVEKAKSHIESLVKEQQGETVQVPRGLHHAVANNGQTFRRLRNDHQVTVDHAGQAVPPKTAPPSSAQTNGGSIPLPLITDSDEALVEAHSWKIVDLVSTEEGDIPWVLRGNADNVEKAKKVIAAALEQAAKQNAMGFLVLPDPRTYRHVIGPGGSKVNSIRKQSGCKITVPRDQSKDEAIEVVGTRDGVEKAKDLILQAVREGINGGARTRD